MQPKLQPAKNIVPDPPLPTRTDSSPKCGPTELTTGISAIPQKPVWPLLRSTLQLRGQSVQGFMQSHNFWTDSLKEPVLVGKDVIIGFDFSIILAGPQTQTISSGVTIHSICQWFGSEELKATIPPCLKATVPANSEPVKRSDVSLLTKGR